MHDCLQAIADQTEAPDEVIVVDNNSTDNSIKIAKQFPFVNVIHESKRGLITSRNRGFNSAKSDLLARIDADALLSSGWVARAKQDLMNPHIAGVTGLAWADSLPYIHWPKTTLWSHLYFWWSETFFGVPILWGANMVIRKKVWQQIKNEAETDDQNVHEDQDLSLLIASHGWHILRDKRLHITINGQSYFYWPKFYEYLKRRWNTKKHHKNRGTLNNQQALRLPLWQTLPRLIVAFIPGSLFIVCSFLFWQISRLLNFIFRRTPKIRR